ncbi:hypothetical protein PVAP13_9NG245673 [Panicum virgatum]|uniref:Uncharacterized protein n=1 Tax=Panicum virgatum TaxID=38727 RepID=A0A8T0MI06_PANVG|nr:hypothetical protein PVAP13_9NG245673 [Panicum virgatum]
MQSKPASIQSDLQFAALIGRKTCNQSTWFSTSIPLILCFTTLLGRIIAEWCALFHEADESSSSVVSNQIMHFAILYAKHMKVCAGISPEQALVAHWLWRHSEKLLLWSETISCNALNLISETSTAHIYVDGMSSPRADMSWTQCDFSSMESQNSDQCAKGPLAELVRGTRRHSSGPGFDSPWERNSG